MCDAFLRFLKTFKNWPTPVSFFVYRKTVGVSGIRIWILVAEGKLADHLVPTTALFNKMFSFILYKHKFYRNIFMLQQEFELRLSEYKASTLTT